MITPTKKQDGFTLFEVLLAIAILSFLMTLIYSISSSMIETADSVMSEDQDFMQIETALAVMEKDIASLYTPIITEEKSRPLPGAIEGEELTELPNEFYTGYTTKGKIIPKIIHEEKSILKFVTASNKRRLENQKQSNLAWVMYSLENQEDEKARKIAPFKLVRRFTNENLFDEEFEPKNIKPQTLISNVKKMHFEFWDPKDKEYVDSLDRIPRFQKYPNLIRIVMTIVDRSNVDVEIVKSFRSSWPYHDSSKENITKSKSTKKKAEPTPDEDED